MTKDFEGVWKQVEAHQGAVFSTPLGLPFEYEITGEHVSILIYREGGARTPVAFQPLTMDQFRVAHRHMVDGRYESLSRGEERAPYLWGILRGIQENPK